MDPQPSRRTVRRRLMWILFVLVGLYALVVVAAYALQRRGIYFPERLSPPMQAPLSVGEELVGFPSADGTRVTGLYVAPRDPDASVVLVLHGNAGNLLTWRPFLDPFTRRGLGAFLLDPRGYGWSEGSPDEAGWHQDAQAAVLWLASKGVPDARLIVVGVSIGSGLAVPLAAARPVRALILQSAFTRLADVASDHIPLLPWSLILRDRYENLSAAPRVRCPVLVLHGTADGIVPAEQAHRMAAAFPSPALLRLAPGVDHNDVGAWAGYEPALEEFLRSLP